MSTGPTPPVTPSGAAAAPSITTLGMLAEFAKEIFKSTFSGAADIFKDIAALDKDGDEQIQKLEDVEGGFGSFLTRLFSSAAKPTDKIELNIGGSKLAVNAKGSVAKTAENGLFSPEQVYGFVKTAFANKTLVEKGIYLQILNDDGVTAKDKDKYTDKDRMNLALCLVAAQQNGLHIINEGELFQDEKLFKGRMNLITDAKAKWSAFAAVTDMPENPKFKEAKARLDQLGQEASVGKMKATINQPVGMAFKSAGFITKDDFDNVGAVQAELLAIREAVKAADGNLDPAKAGLLPQFKGAPDLVPLIADEAARKDVITKLNIEQDAIAQALLVVNAMKGVNAQDEKLLVPLVGMIQEKICIDPESKAAFLSAQQFERLMRDIERLETIGADPQAAAKVSDLRSFPNDPDIMKAIQEARRHLNDAEKAAQPKEIIPARDVVFGTNLRDVSTHIRSLFDHAISGQTNDQKQKALETLKSYSAGSAEFNIQTLENRPAPTAPQEDAEPEDGEAPAAAAT